MLPVVRFLGSGAVVRACALLLGTITFAGCSLKSANDGARLSLVMPNPRTFALRSDSSSILGVAPSAWNDPGFVCYGVNVIGSGIADSSRNPKPAPDLTSLIAGTTSCAYRGVVSNGFTFAAGQTEATIDLQVPPGTARVIQLIGITNAAYCQSNFLESDLVGSPEAYELGKVVTDLFGDTTVSIPVTYTLANSSARRVDCGGSAATISATVTATPPNPGNYVNLSNQSTLTLAGSCSEATEPVVFTLGGTAAGFVNCSVGNTWTQTFDLSNAATYPDGSIAFSVSHAAPGGPNATANLALTKDTAPPGAPSLLQQGGGVYATSTSVTLAIAATGVTEMYLTSTAGCAAGGTWIAYATTSPYTLLNSEAVNTVYAKVRDAAQNESSCVSASITHDGIDPTAPTSLGWAQASPFNTLAVNATWTKSASIDLASQGIQFFSDGACTTASGAMISLTAADQTYAWSAPSAGTYSYKVKSYDNAGRFFLSACSGALVIDPTPPAAASGLMWGAGGATSTSQTITANWTKSISPDLADQSLKIFSDATCTTLVGTFPLASSVLQTYAYATGADGTFSFLVKSQDAAGNITDSSCSGGVLVDSFAPTVAITSPTAGSYINAASVASFAVSGSCTENGRNVSLSGAASATVTCSALTWTANLNFSGAADGAVVLYVDHSDAAGNSASQDSRNFTKDTTAPTVAITSPAPSTVVPFASMNAFPVSGTCSEMGEAVTISGGGSATTNCTSGSWSTTVDLTAASSGSLNLLADHSDLALNVATQSSRSFTKDTVAPTVTVSAPNGGEVFDAGQVVSITWSAADNVGLDPNPISIAYSTDGGATFPNPIATSEPNDGIYSWTVPASGPNMNVRIRVTAIDQAGVSASDDSNSNFTVVGPATKLALLTNGGTAPLNMNTESCYGPLIIEAQDANGYPSPVTAATSVGLSGGAAVTFHPTPACNGGVLSSANIASGTTTTSVFYKANLSTTSTVNVSVSAGPALTAAANNFISASTGTWSTDVSLGGIRFGHSSVWTGTEMIVWGGGASGAASDTGVSGAIGASGASTLSLTSAPSARAFHSAVWTGTEMIVFGGQNGAAVGGGGRFSAGAWNATVMATAGAPIARYGHSAVWSGTEMIVWGGRNGGTFYSDGGRYNPTTNTWTALANAALTARAGHVGVIGGTKLLVWGGENGTAVLGDGKIYDTGSQTWSAISMTGAPSPRVDAAAVWTGSKFLVWGGRNFNNTTYFNDGAAYDPSLDTWTPIDPIGAPLGRAEARAVWTGSKMVVFGGGSPNNPVFGGAYNPTTSNWESITGFGSTSARAPTLLWTGSQVLFYGGDTNSDVNLHILGGGYTP